MTRETYLGQSTPQLSLSLHKLHYNPNSKKLISANSVFSVFSFFFFFYLLLKDNIHTHKKHINECSAQFSKLNLYNQHPGQETVTASHTSRETKCLLIISCPFLELLVASFVCFLVGSLSFLIAL